jgi:hypothetical protein
MAFFIVTAVKTSNLTGITSVWPYKNNGKYNYTEKGILIDT